MCSHWTLVNTFSCIGARWQTWLRMAQPEEEWLYFSCTMCTDQFQTVETFGPHVTIIFNESNQKFEDWRNIMKYEVWERHVCVCSASRSEVCGEEESSSPSGDDQCGLSAYHDGQQQRRFAHTCTQTHRVSPLKTSFNPRHDVFSSVCACRFSRSSTGDHRELHEADPDDSAGSAGVKVTSVAAASLWGRAPPLLHL